MKSSLLRRSSAGMGRTNHKLQPKQKKSSLKSTVVPVRKDVFFFEEWIPDEKPDQATNDPPRFAADTKLHIIKEEESVGSCHRWEVDDEEEIKKRFLEYYVTMRASEECLLLPKKLSSPKLVIESALKYYNSFSERNHSLCGPKLCNEIPCIIQIGGVLACIEFERLSLNPKFSKWIDNLADLDSALCVIVNQLVRESDSLVRCWWSSENQCFVLFCHITITAIGVQMNEEKAEAIPTMDIGMSTEGEEKEAQPVRVVVKPIPIRPCTQFLPQENHKD